MVTIVEQAGCQYKVSEGDTISIPYIDEAEDGQEITLDRVLLIGEGDSIRIGKPVVDGAEVRAKIVGECKDKKVVIIKKKRRKDYKLKKGHRQKYTKVQITSIKAA